MPPYSHLSIDSAILRLLSLTPSPSLTMTPLSGAGMSSASTFKLSTSSAKTSPSTYFVKTGRGQASATMFRGEHASLNAVHDAVPSLCPRSYGWGMLDGDGGDGAGVGNGKDAFLVTEFLDLSPGKGGNGTTEMKKLSLAQKLAMLHTTPAPSVSDGKGNNNENSTANDGSTARRMFGFPVPTCCGDTPQKNDFKTSWAEFFAHNRLLFILEQSEKVNGVDVELGQFVRTVIERVVPRLIGDDHLKGGKGVLPVVVHGDLWSGNKGRGAIAGGHVQEEGSDEIEEVVFDPSACYAHSEYELGIMNMFGGFGKAFWDEYHGLVPKTEPVEEYEDRIKLYELYHHLNHHALFGGGYRGGAMSIMKRLIQRYGND